MSSVGALTGQLQLRPGQQPSVSCERPLIGEALLGRLTQGRHAALLPDLLGSLFTLCAPAHRQTARRAVLAACGRSDAEADRRRDALSIALHTAREHLHRLAIDWARLAPSGAGEAEGATWLRDAPVIVGSAAGVSARDAQWQEAAAALPGWLQRRLFGMSPSAWLARWTTDGGRWLERWCAEHEHAVTRVLRAVQRPAQQQHWRSHPLDVAEQGAEGWRALANALAADAGFAARPSWRGAPAETGPWTRQGRSQPVASAWDRLGARLADLAQIGEGAVLACGALPLAPGEAIAWSEMSRGLLVHWLRLEGGTTDPALARVERLQVLAPTEWNFHPDGGFARWLGAARGARDGAAVSLAAMALDPCLAFTIEAEVLPDA